MKNLVKLGVFFALALVPALNSCDFEPPGRTIFIDDNPSGRNSALFTVTFDSEGADKPAQPGSMVMAAAGGNAMPASPPERVGFVFSGWFTGQNGGGQPLGAATLVTGSTTVYALWTPVPVSPASVTFDKNGGKYDASPREKKVTKGTAIAGIEENAAAVLPQEPYRENYNFKGWNTRADGSGAVFDETTVVNGDITVYAQWEYDAAIVRYTVTFDSDDADVKAKPDKVVVTGAGGNAMPATLPEKTGYIFGGWFTGKYGNGKAFDASYKVTGNITVYALWTPVPEDPVTITFDKNGGKYDASPREKEVTKGTAIDAIPEGAAAVLPQVPYRENYSFQGWKTEPNGGAPFDAGTVVNEDIIVYAQWKYEAGSVRYTVTFDSDGAEKPAAPDLVVVTAAEGNAMPVTLPEKEGYFFGGWYTQKNGGGEAFGESYTVTGDIRVYAKWTLRSATSVGIIITFETNGGTWNDGSAATIFIPVTPTSGIPIPAQDLSKAGSYFTGWNTKANGGGDPFGAAYQVTEDITVYAQWKALPPDAVYVTFDKNSGGDKAYDASPSVMAVTQGLTIGALPQAPFWEGHDFTGWEDQDGFKFTETNVISANMRVYAQWSYNPDFPKYTVTFNSAGADKEVSPRFVKVSDNGGNAMPATLPEKTDYIFAGWYTNPDGKGSLFSASFPVKDDMVVYAWWIPKPSEGSVLVTVSFNENGGTTKASPQTLTVKQGATVPAGNMPVNPVREGYSVKSWNLKADGSGDVFTSSYMVSVDTTVYAQWELNTYTISFNMKGATSTQISAQSVKHGGRVTKPTNPTRTYFTFGDWYVDSAAQSVKWDFTTLVTGAVTLYARWDYVQPITDFSRVQGYLQEQKDLGKGKNEYEAIPLGVQYDLGKMTDVDSAWQKLLEELNTKGIYVKLDLSKATLNSMTAGEFNPAGNTELIQNGKGYITTLTLPTVAKKLTAGTSAAPSFGYFTALTDITGSGVTEIGAYTFAGPYEEMQYHNYKLVTASFPAAVTIGDCAFRYCVSLKEANYPLATTVGNYAFGYCNALATVNFPKVEELAISCFTYSGITAVNFPALKTIGTGNFGYCKSLKTVNLPLVTVVSAACFQYCSLLETVTLENATTIAIHVFRDCTSLKTLSCPKLTSFGDSVFVYTGTTALTITLGATPPSVGLYPFYGAGSKTVTIKTTNTANYNSAWQTSFKDGNSSMTLKITN